MRRPGRVFSREQLLSEVWGYAVAAALTRELLETLGDLEIDVAIGRDLWSDGEAGRRIGESGEGVAGRRTRTQLDDVLTLTVGRLPPMRGAALALVVYVVLGIVVPLVLDPAAAGSSFSAFSVPHGAL